MELFRGIESKRDNKGRLRRWGIFYCGHCKNYVEKLLYNGKKSKYCGCYIELKHGGTRTRLYYTYQDIKQRCNNPNNKAYIYYGGRGIKVCNEWLDKEIGFINFSTWAVQNGYSDDLVIDRRNPDGNYEPNNCRFLTILESLRNKTNTITMEIANEIRDLAKTGLYTQRELAKVFGISFQTINFIINNKQWVDKK